MLQIQLVLSMLRAKNKQRHAALHCFALLKGSNLGVCLLPMKPSHRWVKCWLWVSKTSFILVLRLVPSVPHKQQHRNIMKPSTCESCDANWELKCDLYYFTKSLFLWPFYWEKDALKGCELRSGHVEQAVAMLGCKTVLKKHKSLQNLASWVLKVLPAFLYSSPKHTTYTEPKIKQLQLYSSVTDN